MVLLEQGQEVGQQTCTNGQKCLNT